MLYVICYMLYVIYYILYIIYYILYVIYYILYIIYYILYIIYYISYIIFHIHISYSILHIHPYPYIRSEATLLNGAAATQGGGVWGGGRPPRFSGGVRGGVSPPRVTYFPYFRPYFSIFPAILFPFSGPLKGALSVEARFSIEHSGFSVCYN